MSGEPPSSYPVKLRPYSDKYSHTTPGEYLEVPIPDEIKKFGLEEGDTIYMYSELDANPPYLKIRVTDFGTRHDLKLKYRDDLHPKHSVTLPTEFTVHRDDSPFQGISKDDTVNVEFSQESEPEIRVYTEDGYRERTAQLVSNDQTPTLKAPVIAPILSRLTGQYVDLAESTPYPGHKFRILPFDGQSNRFIREADEKYLDSDDMEINADPELLERVLERKGLPRQRVKKIQIGWVPHLYGAKLDGPEKTVPDRAPPALSNFTYVEEEGDRQERKLIYEDYFTKEARVILPEIGAYEIRTMTKTGRGRTWLYYFSKSQYPDLAKKFPEDGWYAYYFSKPATEDRPYRVFAPSPSEFPRSLTSGFTAYEKDLDEIEVIWPLHDWDDFSS